MALWLKRLRLWREPMVGPGKYDLLTNGEVNEKSLFRTFMSNQMPAEQVDQRGSNHDVPRRLVFVIFGIMGAITLVLSLLLAESRRQIPKRAKSPVPDFPTLSETWKREMNWEFGPESEDLWASIFPGKGFILVDHPERYDLPSGLATSVIDAAVYGVSVTHQIHCIKMVREYFWGVVSGNATYLEILQPPSDLSQPLPSHLDHAFHCFDYLRKTALCNADMTVEWEAKEKGHIDGYGIPHQCRDWSQVRAWMAMRVPPEAEYRRPQ